MADIQIHYNFINNTVFVSHNVVLRGDNVVVLTSNMWFVNKVNVYLNICFNVFGKHG